MESFVYRIKHTKSGLFLTAGGNLDKEKDGKIFTKRPSLEPYFLDGKKYRYFPVNYGLRKKLSIHEHPDRYQVGREDLEIITYRLIEYQHDKN